MLDLNNPSHKRSLLTSQKPGTTRVKVHSVQLPKITFGAKPPYQSKFTQPMLTFGL